MLFLLFIDLKLQKIIKLLTFWKEEISLNTKYKNSMIIRYLRLFMNNLPGGQFYFNHFKSLIYVKYVFVIKMLHIFLFGII